MYCLGAWNAGFLISGTHGDLGGPWHLEHAFREALM